MVLGIDIGTTTISAVMIDSKTGKIEKSITRENNSKRTTENTSFERLQDPEHMFRIVSEILSEVKECVTDLEGIGLTGQMHGIVYLDSEGQAVSPLMNWQDERGNQIYRDHKSYAKVLSDLTGHKMASGYGLTTHYYNMQNGIIPKEAVQMTTIHGYIAMRLTECKKAILHTSDAASFGLFDLNRFQFDSEAVIKAGIQKDILPTVTTEIQSLGNYQGICPVYLPIGDNQAGFLGTVEDTRHTISINIGTSSQVSIFHEKYVTGETFECRPFLGKTYLLVGAPLCGGRAYAMLEKFFRESIMLSGNGCDCLFEQMNQAAKELLDEIELHGIKHYNKLEIDTRFAGARQNPLQRGMIQNIGIENFTPAHMILGFLEGMIGELKNIFLSMQKVSHEEFFRIAGSGNALRKNPALIQIAERDFKVPVIFSQQGEEAAMGAAKICRIMMEKLPEK